MLPSKPKSTLSPRFTTFIHALLFVLGFTVVFVVGWGGAATALGRLFTTHKELLTRLGGGLIILFGLFTLQVIHIPWLNYDTRPQWSAFKGNRWFSSFIMGIFFAAGWTPCIGPTLGAILTLGMSQQATAQAMLLSSGYALGLGIPFLILGFGMDRVMMQLAKVKRHVHLIEIFTGVFLIALGMLMLFGRLTWLNQVLGQWSFSIDFPTNGVATPSYLIALLAGLLSFFSPCVLPLLPIYLGYLSGAALWDERIA